SAIGGPPALRAPPCAVGRPPYRAAPRALHPAPPRRSSDLVVEGGEVAGGAVRRIARHPVWLAGVAVVEGAVDAERPAEHRAVLEPHLERLLRAGPGGVALVGHHEGAADPDPGAEEVALGGVEP